jgi:hypothetical protein
VKSVKVKVDVTAEDIMQGRRKSLCWCPIALAASRALETHVDVGKATAQVWDPLHEVWGEGPRARLPQEAQQFIRDFDLHGQYAVSPLSFELEFMDARLVDEE